GRQEGRREASKGRQEGRRQEGQGRQDGRRQQVFHRQGGCRQDGSREEGERGQGRRRQDGCGQGCCSCTKEVNEPGEDGVQPASRPAKKAGRPPAFFAFHAATFETHAREPASASRRNG